MVELFGRSRSRTELHERTGALERAAGGELLEDADGPQHGGRVLDFRIGAGLSFRVAVDHPFDLLAAEYRGVRADSTPQTATRPGLGDRS